MMGALGPAPLRARDEPLFGLDCQESTRGLVPFFLALLTSFFDWVPTRVPRRLGSVNERFERVFAR